MGDVVQSSPRWAPGEATTYKLSPSSAMESESGKCAKSDTGMHHWKFGKCKYCQKPEGKLVSGIGAITNPGSDRECEHGGKCIFKFAKCTKCGTSEYTTGTQRRLSRNSLKLQRAVELDSNVGAMFDQFDVNGDGAISIEEFKEIVTEANSVT